MSSKENAKKPLSNGKLSWAKHRRNVEGYIMILPFIALFILFYIIPIFWSLILSLNNYDFFSPMRFVGLNNFINLFTNDDLFLTAIKNTLIYSVFAGPLGFISSFFFAWVINQLKFKNVFSLAFYAPSIVSAYATTYVWLVLFSPDPNGTLNSFLLKLGFINEPIYWTTDSRYIMPVVIIVSIWMSMGAGFLTNLAGFNNVNPEIYEAARIDGVKSRFQELFYVTVPQMKPQLLFNAIMGTVNSLSVSYQITALVGYPTPDNAGHTITMHMYDYAFNRFEMGYAAAISFVLFAITFVLGQVFMKIFSDRD